MTPRQQLRGCFSTMLRASKHQASLHLARIATAGLSAAAAEWTNDVDSDNEVFEITTGNFCMEAAASERLGDNTVIIDLRAALQTALPQVLGLQEADLSRLLNSLQVSEVPACSPVQLKGDEVTGVHVLLTQGKAVLDNDTGEWCGDTALNTDSLMFGTHASRRSLVTGPHAVQMVTLHRRSYEQWDVLKLLLLRTKFCILDTLSDAALLALQGQYIFFDAGDELQVDAVALITHGVLHVAGTSLKAFPGHVLGVDSAMRGSASSAVAETCGACCILSASEFAELMATEEAFMKAVSELAFQQCVDAERRSSVNSAGRSDRSDSDSRSNSNSQPHLMQQLQQECSTGASPFRIVRTSSRYNASDGTAHLNQYTLGCRIGGGGTSTVFLASDELQPQCHFAMKVVSRSEQRSIDRELQALQALQPHPHIVEVHEVIDSPALNAVCIVLQYAAWGSLLKVHLDHAAARSCARCCIAGLQYMHEKGFLHGDIKPANLLRDASGHVVLADLGCASRVQKAEQELCPQGTPAYMAPEAFTGQAGVAADVWSLVATLYCLVQGHAPFRSYEQGATLRDAICYTTPVLDFKGCSALDAANFSNLCSWGMKKNPADRIMLDELEEHSWVQQGSHTGRHEVEKIQQQQQQH